MRGMKIAPQLLPAQVCATRIQQELFSSLVPSRSQKNWTLMRPYWSVQISSPDLPTTTAVWVLGITGLRPRRGGRKGTVLGMASNSLEYSNGSVWPRRGGRKGTVLGMASNSLEY